MRCSSGCAITRAPGGADDSLTAWQDQTSDIRRRSAIASPIRANSTRPQRVARSGQDHTSPARTPQAAVAGRLNPARLLADQRADAGAHPGRITRRVGCEQAGRADGAPDELAAAVRADAVQDVLRAVAAPGALVRADEHVRGCRVEVPVAAFAVRPQL